MAYRTLFMYEDGIESGYTVLEDSSYRGIPNRKSKILNICIL